MPNLEITVADLRAGKTFKELFPDANVCEVFDAECEADKSKIFIAALCAKFAECAEYAKSHQELAGDTPISALPFFS
jgi:hypothetical protein